MATKIAEFRSYLTDVKQELKRVVWPSRKETTQTTMMVFGMVVLLSLFLWLVDMSASWLVGLIIGG
ncbi:MAG: preprotein translocase subunit SecE [Alphaproteobacteria bacterium CG_4_10_14_0_2_um_filter_63_37]|nr:MAG: preprotein translocase subunit SecE [Proteobacteria bacterium CG1_02_64_396]PJA23635.1 MAG: preprotein translocase subunit SecE [Alphaproteobacteria bacterium CG_4_10_14_0_2_um_filter_63_37]